MPPNTGVTALHFFSTNLGWMAAAWQEAVLVRLTSGHQTLADAAAALEIGAANAGEPNRSQRKMVARLTAYAAGKPDDLRDLPLDLDHYTPFARQVVENCRAIPYGATLSYGQLAAQAGSSRAARAVGNVMRTNRIPLIIPCHRVVGAGHSLGGYSAPEGLTMKRRLLQLEQQGLGKLKA